mmetsp:Transcript_117908/g.279825  ORF Transcript_117908/g.279825 Transcript_117908/m.279825 type:complete len:308 (-) Transcript_117908:367-1290(-)
MHLFEEGSLSFLQGRNGRLRRPRCLRRLGREHVVVVFRDRVVRHGRNCSLEEHQIPAPQRRQRLHPGAQHCGAGHLAVLEVEGVEWTLLAWRGVGACMEAAPQIRQKLKEHLLPFWVCHMHPKRFRANRHEGLIHVGHHHGSEAPAIPGHVEGHCLIEGDQIHCALQGVWCLEGLLQGLQGCGGEASLDGLGRGLHGEANRRDEGPGQILFQERRGGEVDRAEDQLRVRVGIRSLGVALHVFQECLGHIQAVATHVARKLSVFPYAPLEVGIGIAPASGTSQWLFLASVRNWQRCKIRAIRKGRKDH